MRKQGCFSKFEIVSETSFPIEAGLASSAAGFAAIAFGLGQIYQLDISDIVRIARLGSGSACRSILSGLVHWKSGAKEDGTDCVCQTVFENNYWPTLRSIILVTSCEAKEIPSSFGMQLSVKTSNLLHARVERVPDQVKKLTDAFRERNFEKLAEVTMMESGQLHAVCMDTMPPLKYLNDSSWHLIRLVHALNRFCKCTKVAYTFDAGPNCCLFVEAENVPLVLAAIDKYCTLPPCLIEKLETCSVSRECANFRGMVEEKKKNLLLFDSPLIEGYNLNNKPLEPREGVVKDIFLSCVGAGPIVISE